MCRELKQKENIIKEDKYVHREKYSKKDKTEYEGKKLGTSKIK